MNFLSRLDGIYYIEHNILPNNVAHFFYGLVLQVYITQCVLLIVLVLSVFRIRALGLV